MKKKNQEFNDEDTMRDEYHFDYSKAVWGKHAKRLMEEGSNVVTIQPDVFEVFPDSDSVNEALRQVIALGKLTRKGKKPVRKARQRKIKAKAPVARVAKR